MTTMTTHPPRCSCADHRSEREATAKAAFAEREPRVARIQTLNAQLAEAGRVAERTGQDLAHITSTGIAPSLLDVATRRHAAPAAATAWAERIVDARAKLDALYASLGPLLDEQAAEAKAIAEDTAAQWAAIQEAEADEQRRQELDAQVDAEVDAAETARLQAIRDEARARLAATEGETNR